MKDQLRRCDIEYVVQLHSSTYQPHSQRGYVGLQGLSIWPVTAHHPFYSKARQPSEGGTVRKGQYLVVLVPIRHIYMYNIYAMKANGEYTIDNHNQQLM